MPHINEQWEQLKSVAREMIQDAALLAITEYRQAYPKDPAVSSPHLPEAIAARVIGKLDDLFYTAAKMLREQEEAARATEAKKSEKKKRGGLA